MFIVDFHVFFSRGIQPGVFVMVARVLHKPEVSWLSIFSMTKIFVSVLSSEEISLHNIEF